MAIICAIIVGIRALLYILGGMTDVETSKSGLIKVSTVLIGYIIFRNMVKSYFRKKIK
ncbi:hypothetical protein POV27_07500 [Aureisphaera galaxeae]|uniref:hypothetical protein n=1 Tax=Aureisphaera galaxeae TaxID=1538023 RepID=UPI002350416B|nr:hypothetical protein [Aureisphaera galaxeae]MDC8003892.1 hypothetical protein [Aureisphaera galaxeae]